MVKRLTSDAAKANLYTVGPNLTAAAIQVTTAWLSDYYQQRAFYSAGAILVSLIGFVLLGTLDLVHHVKVGYFITVGFYSQLVSLYYFADFLSISSPSEHSHLAFSFQLGYPATRILLPVVR